MASFKRLYADLNYYQFVARDEWILNDTKVPFDGGNPMPSFIEYDEVWRKAGADNPFLVRWHEIDLETIDVSYLDKVVETLEEQMVWYKVDFEWVREQEILRGESTPILQYIYGFLNAIYGLRNLIVNEFGVVV